MFNARPRYQCTHSLTIALEISGLKKTYANGVVALHDISLSMDSGEFFGLLGPNGAGKSTLISIVCSLTNKSAGQIRVFGHDLDREPQLAKAAIGVVPQEFNFNQYEKVADTLFNQAGYYGITRRKAAHNVEYALTRMGLWDKRARPGRELSGGMKRRLMIARALVHNPRLLILDEPTAGVDIEIRRSMWQFLRDINADGISIILTTHYLEEAESLCERIAIIDRGRIIEDTRTKDLLTKLHTETFVLDLRNRCHLAPVLDGYCVRLVDELTLEVDVTKDSSMNGLFSGLSEQGIDVSSLRNKTNRLEEFFLRLIESEANTA